MADLKGRRHIVYVTPKRRHPCTNENGSPKKRWPNPTSAQFVADLNEFRGKGERVIYHCRVCDGYHTAHPPRAQAYHRVPEREEDRIVELGIRVVADERVENMGHPALRVGAVVKRWPRVMRARYGAR